MKKAKQKRIFLVDDDALFLKSLEIEFTQNSDFNIETFPTGEQCIERLRTSKSNTSEKPDVIVLDYHLDGVVATAMNGLKTLDSIKAYDPETPVIILSSQDKIEVAVNCMKHKAYDYIIKSETAFIRLQKAIADIFQNQKTEKELSWYMERM